MPDNSVVPRVRIRYFQKQQFLAPPQWNRAPLGAPPVPCACLLLLPISQPSFRGALRTVRHQRPLMGFIVCPISRRRPPAPSAAPRPRESPARARSSGGCGAQLSPARAPDVPALGPAVCLRIAPAPPAPPRSAPLAPPLAQAGRNHAAGDRRKHRGRRPADAAPESHFPPPIPPPVSKSTTLL